MKKKKNNSGEKFEIRVYETLEKAGHKARRTCNSGAAFNDGDILLDNFMIDCKLQEFRGTKLLKNMTLKIDEFHKLEQQARGLFKTPIMVLGNGYGEAFAVMKLNEFIELLKE